jgi:hypothetical protein
MKVLLGDNPFFGVNHKVGSKQLAEESFRFAQAVEVLSEAERLGFDRLMITNHPTIKSLLDLTDASELSNLRLAFVLPYPHKYNDLVAKKGYLGLVKYLSKGNFGYLVFNIHKLFKFRRAQDHIVNMITNAELASLAKHRSKVEYVCLHNILVDIYVASGNVSALEAFIVHVKKLGLKPVLITQNLLALNKVLRIKTGYTICFSYNPLGYMVNPSIDLVDEFLAKAAQPIPELWAMQIMGSGVVGLDDALENTSTKKNISGILYATTKKERIAELFAKVQKYKT